GEPIIEKPTRVRASGSSLSARLIPGDYLVVAQIEGHGFHEVYRHVPTRDEGVPQHGLAHQKWTRLTGGAVVLPKIQVPVREVEHEQAGPAYGANDFPWGNSAEKLDEWKMEPVSVSSADTLSTSPPVQGLYSNVAEWTGSWATLYPKMRKLGLSNPAVQVER